ncbi:hypothetical protein [Pseudomonas huanghezhanensis]|uniref:hypothetical protein n=1 Tax=Pseudomonas huanghezhanensis TaxID=3002903 RepID=UPI0022857227|nr:hypothetical protein [Pseudomonas sp. BSw22131]
MSFFAKNAYMGVQSITEVAAMVTKGHTRMLLKGVPILKDMTGWGSAIKPKDLDDMHSMVFGRELVISTGLATAGYVAMKYSQASGMPKDQREKFLQQALDPKMLAYAAISRSSHIGAPLGLLNIVAAPLGFDQGVEIR